ncbi:TonB-linked outer membrane protein, SusC/RagA family [Maribacter sedimenticola]|uniref:TonB-linked outer membrane protein, SusC/RagA family n=1 Tax=Maribacter sedimenticola TaxID=228956 RepID=A0ABY1SDT0_9FLAO|nr:SusC/RagA family TonB-linked outer membrane protein [Maribacter sedimenticola]SNR29565.1 TonB-linked outer membrane protein, SusC/RagA family [Maribacter sedimenticola]
MRTKLKGLLTLLLALVVHLSFAQQKTVSGTVTDQEGLPLPGVNIVVEGTTNGTQTDFDGNYSISASQGQTLLFTYIGQKAVRQTVGAGDTVNVAMQEDAQALEEVVVTAQGIKREKKALGYATSSVGQEALESRAEGDVARVLAGKAAGVNITSGGGMSGSATSVTIRGLSSFSGSNQALFIVDGVPFSNDTNSGGDFLSGNTGSSRFLDIDPNNIANIEVLKGLAATTLYGTLGKNGVILVTTKAAANTGGVKKNEISVNTSYFTNEYASLPEYQTKYGGGFDQAFGWFFSNWGPSFDREGTAGWGAQAAIDENGTLEHPYSTTAIAGTREAFPELQGARYDWRPYDSVEEFFAPGHVTNTSVNFSGGSQDGNTTYNANLGHLNDVGFTPGNQLRRINFSVGGRSKLSNKFTIAGTMNYSRTDYDTPPVSASRGNGGISSNSVYGAVLFTPRNVDLMGLPYENPVTGGSVYYRNGNDIINPRWVTEHIKFNQLTNRFYFNTSLSYEINENLGTTFRTGLDFYNERNTQFSDKGGVEFDFDIFGFLNTFDNNNTIWDHTFSLNGNYDISDKIGLTFNVGANARSDEYDRQGVASSGQIVFGVRRHFNYENQLPIQFSRKRNIVGVFGDVSIDYDNMLFLNLSSRTDWVSNLITENRSLTYPGASLSFLPTAAFSGLRSEGGLNYLKLRASYGTSANFPENYPTVSGVDQNTQQSGGAFGPVTLNSISSFKANPNLKPELLKEFEVGFESKFFNNRVSLDATYYDRRTDDLIVTEPLSPSTGFQFTQSNIGQISNKGYEADLGIDFFRNPDGFSWKSSVNFFANKEIVEEQEQDIIIYTGNSALFIGGNAAIKGESLGSIVGTAFARNENGDLLTNAAGNYVITESDLDGNVPIIGDAVPDYTMNFINSLSYKNWSLGFQINHIKGGDIMSSTIATLLGRGLIVETEDRLNTYILPGVNQTTGQPNDVQINNSTYYFSNLLFGPAEAKIYDASVIRLQEVSLGYSLPKRFLEKTPFGSLTFTVQGFNLWYDAYNTPDGANFDPNVAGVGVGNGRGFDFLNGPSTRRYGMSVKMTF